MSTDLFEQLRAYGDQLDVLGGSIDPSEAKAHDSAIEDGGVVVDLRGRRNGDGSPVAGARFLLAVAAAAAFVIVTVLALRAGDTNSQELITDEPKFTTTTTSTTTTMPIPRPA